MQYNIGDKVVIRKNLEHGEQYSGMWHFEGNNSDGGKTIEITRISSNNYYDIKGASFNSYLTDEMIDHEATKNLNNNTINYEIY